MGFLTGTIWITDLVEYEDASNIADLVSKDVAALYRELRGGIKGFIGETALFPGEPFKGKLISTMLSVDEDAVPLIFLGRYFGYGHYMSQLHPYSSAIYLNKKEVLRLV